MRERSEELRSKLTSALIYPCVLLLTAVGAVVVLLTVVVPRMEPMFAQAGAALPASTKVVLAATDLLRDYGYLILAVSAVVLLLGERILRRPGPRRLADAWVLRLPLLGPLLRDRITAQLCRSLATCLGGGLDLPSALVVSRDILGNQYARAAMDEVVTAVRTGRTVADSLTAAGIMTPLAVKMLRVGEESGRLQAVAAPSRGYVRGQGGDAPAASGCDHRARDGDCAGSGGWRNCDVDPDRGAERQRSGLVTRPRPAGPGYARRY